MRQHTNAPLALARVAVTAFLAAMAVAAADPGRAQEPPVEDEWLAPADEDEPEDEKDAPAPPAAGGHWKLTGTDRYQHPSNHACYPLTVTVSDGSMTESTKLVCTNPEGAFVWTATWTRPPEVLVPGQKVELTLSASIGTDESRGLSLGGNVSAALDRRGLGWGAGTHAGLAFTPKSVAVRARDPKIPSAREIGSIVVPGEGFAGTKDTGKIQLRVDAGLASWFYFYDWVGVPAAPAPVPPPTVPLPPDPLPPPQQEPASNLSLEEVVRDEMLDLLGEFSDTCFARENVASTGSTARFLGALSEVTVVVDPTLSSNARYTSSPLGNTLTVSLDPRRNRGNDHLRRTIWHELMHHLENRNGDFEHPENDVDAYKERNVEYAEGASVELRKLRQLEKRAREGKLSIQARSDFATIIQRLRRLEHKPGRLYQPSLDRFREWTGFSARADQLLALYRSGRCGRALQVLALTVKDIGTDADEGDPGEGEDLGADDGDKARPMPDDEPTPGPEAGEDPAAPDDEPEADDAPDDEGPTSSR